MAAAGVVVLPATEDRNEAYAQVGLHVLDASNVIIVIWDGRPSQGEGGTADIVQRALDRGMPIRHIEVCNRKPGTNQPTSLGAEQVDPTIGIPDEGSDPVQYPERRRVVSHLDSGLRPRAITSAKKNGYCMFALAVDMRLAEGGCRSSA